MSDTQNALDEELVWIDLPHTDGLKVKAILQGVLDKPVAVMVHGRPGMPDGPTPTRTGEFFNKRGITCLRLYMYGSAPNTRDLADCNLESYTRDFETVVAYLLAHKTPKVFGIGHSYGGLAIINSSARLNAAVLWDPVHGSYWSEYPGIKQSTTEPLGEHMTMGDTTELAAHKGYPLKIISAGSGKMTEFHKRYIAVADEPKAHSVIDGARHNLGDTLQIIDDLRQQTADWLVQYI